MKKNQNMWNWFSCKTNEKSEKSIWRRKDIEEKKRIKLWILNKIDTIWKKAKICETDFNGRQPKNLKKVYEEKTLRKKLDKTMNIEQNWYPMKKIAKIYETYFNEDNKKKKLKKVHEEKVLKKRREWNCGYWTKLMIKSKTDDKK